MNWYEQSSEMLKIWSETQEKMLSQWVAATASTDSGEQSADFTSINDMWRKTMLENLKETTQYMDSTAQDVIQKLFASQITTMQLLELAMQTWQAMLPSVHAGENWQAILDKQMLFVRNHVSQVTITGMRSMNNMQQLWTKYLSEANMLNTPWLKTLQDNTRLYQGFMQDNKAALIEMTSLYSDAFNNSFHNLFQIQGLSYSRDLEKSVQRSFAAWIEFQQASYEYQSIFVEAWLEAFERLMQELAELDKEGESLESVRDFLNRWSFIADGIFKRTFLSEQYATRQGEFVNTMMAYRKEQAQVNEHIMKMYDIPTRSELDETHRRIYDLRKEVRALKREIAELKSEKILQDAKGKKSE